MKASLWCRADRRIRTPAGFYTPTCFQDTPLQPLEYIRIWSTWRGTISQQPDWKSGTLPIELHVHIMIKTAVLQTPFNYCFQLGTPRWTLSCFSNTAGQLNRTDVSNRHLRSTVIILNKTCTVCISFKIAELLDAASLWVGWRRHIQAFLSSSCYSVNVRLVVWALYLVIDCVCPYAITTATRLRCYHRLKMVKQ